MLSGFTGIALYQAMLILLAAIAALLLMKKTKENFYRIAIVVCILVFYFVMRILPGMLGFQNFTMPWESRTFSIVFGLLCFMII